VTKVLFGTSQTHRRYLVSKKYENAANVLTVINLLFFFVFFVLVKNKIILNFVIFVAKLSI
jgi:hypothetical protein